LITSLKLAKKIFKQIVSEQEKVHEEKLREEKEKNKKTFRKMLSEYEFINTQMRFKNVIPIFQGDPRWSLLDESEREKEF
jgi:hypothetical protein